MKKDEIQLHKEIINSAGFKSINRMKYHNDCISIVSGNFSSLSKALLHFENFKNAIELIGQNNREVTANYLNEISRLLQNFLASAKALVGHTRIFINEYYRDTEIYQQYINKLKKDFSDDGLTKFIQDLRNFCLHRGLPYTGLSLKYDLKTTVFLDRDSMLEWENWTALSRTFLSSLPEQISVYDIVSEYTQKVDIFNNWLNRLLKNYHKKDLEELELLRKQYY